MRKHSLVDGLPEQDVTGYGPQFKAGKFIVLRLNILNVHHITPPKMLLLRDFSINQEVLISM